MRCEVPYLKYIDLHPTRTSRAASSQRELSSIHDEQLSLSSCNQATSELGDFPKQNDRDRHTTLAV